MIRALNMPTLRSNRISEAIVITVRSQPSVMSPIVWRSPAKPFVECLAVIVLVKVAKLVEHKVLDAHRRQQDHRPVEVQHVVLAAGTPTVPKNRGP